MLYYRNYMSLVFSVPFEDGAIKSTMMAISSMIRVATWGHAVAFALQHATITATFLHHHRDAPKQSCLSRVTMTVGDGNRGSNGNACCDQAPSSSHRRRSLAAMLAGGGGGGGFFSGLFGDNNEDAKRGNVANAAEGVGVASMGPTNEVVKSVNGMRQRRLGGSDIVVSELGLGTQRW